MNLGLFGLNSLALLSLKQDACGRTGFSNVISVKVFNSLKLLFSFHRVELYEDQSKR